MSSAVLQGSVNDGPWPLLAIPTHDNDSFSRLAYLPDGRRVVTRSHGGTVKVWNLENGGQEGTSMEHKSELLGFAVTHDGKKIISSDGAGRVKVWDVESHKLVREWPCSEPEECPNIAISPDDQFIASIDVGDDEDEDAPVFVWCMSFSPNGDKLACGINHDIHVYDVKTGALILGPLQGHNRDMECVLWSRDGDRLFSASDDETICCWNSDTGEQIGHPWVGHTNWIGSLSLSPDGSILASASWDKTVRFWDATTGDPIGQCLQHDGPAIVVSFLPSGDFVASIDDKKIYLWRVPWRSSVTLPGINYKLARMRTSPEQAEELRRVYALNDHPTREQRQELADKISMRLQSVTNWFQNQRSRAKKHREKSASTQDVSTHPAQRQPSSSGDGPLSSHVPHPLLPPRFHQPSSMAREHEFRPAPLKLLSAGVDDYLAAAAHQSRISLPPSINSRMSSPRTWRNIMPYARGPRDFRKREERSGVSTKGANPHEHEVSSGSSVYDDDDAMDLVNEVEQQPDPASPTVHSTLPHSRPTSFLAQEPLCGASGLNTNLPRPPDLTRYITRVNDQYIAGGGFGDVYRCWYHDNLPKEVAVKAFRFAFATNGDANEKSDKMLRRELGIWRRLDHKNIVPFLGVAYGFGMCGAMSLVSLWMPNESLHRFLVKYHDNLDLGHRLRFLLDIANGLQYLHSLAIVHGDLNCNNVLLDSDYTARLADFGYASLVGIIPEALTYLRRSTARAGALRWIAPEQVDEDEACKRTTKSDIWSFGCITLQGSWMDTNPHLR
ncbi:WD40-repeat-containing domain protein [Boletus edulis BED1]|uniref:WD40-repeat-containing domain protein n=1 Tax=Boletus edulis BED1 TaxID=1328754 RepID=A0AAD4G6R4_BOLED|nr:WD40-repeat-containing domain protein [Boletus edulis BED1]